VDGGRQRQQEANRPMISAGDQRKLRRRARLPRAECPKDFANSKVMKNAGIVLLLIFSPLSLASADVVGTLNVHTAADGHRTTGRDSGQPVAVQVDFSRTQDGTYDVTVWSGERHPPDRARNKKEPVA
jgi:hypothetical protein